jgi:hypothetical protein
MSTFPSSAKSTHNTISNDCRENNFAGKKEFKFTLQISID